MKKISIISINLNNLNGLQKTVSSVINQTYLIFEFIIIDGGSVDGSVEFISNIDSKILSYWTSEKDTGIYEAMNKGIVKSNGEYLIFLNSGDIFLNKYSLEQLFSYEFKEDIIYCDIVSNVNNKIISFPDDLRFSYFINYTINHQSCLIKKKLFTEIGLYNTLNKITSDWEFFLKSIFIHNRSYRHISIPLILFDFKSGISTSGLYDKLMIQERTNFLIQNFPGFISDYEFINAIRKSRSHNLLIKILNLSFLKNLFSK